MIFFTGMHDLHNAGAVPAACISVSRLARRRKAVPVRRCIIDSGGFQAIAKHGGYPDPPSTYAAELRRLKAMLGRRLLAAVAQDFMCEPAALAKTGLSVTAHQRLTIERYDALVACDTGGTRIMPVLQGYTPDSYVDHIRQYGDRLAHRMWVGVGSVCKRNADPAAIVDVLLAISRVRPDLRLHAFGVKLTALEWQLVRDLIFSADSLAWSFAARFEGRDANSPAEAARYARRIATMPVQLYMPELAA